LIGVVVAVVSMSQRIIFAFRLPSCRRCTGGIALPFDFGDWPKDPVGGEGDVSGW